MIRHVFIQIMKCISNGPFRIILFDLYSKLNYVLMQNSWNTPYAVHNRDFQSEFVQYLTILKSESK